MRKRLLVGLYGLSTGGITLALTSGFGGIAFSNIITGFIAQLVSALVTFFLGGDLATQLLGGRLGAIG